MKLAPLLKKAEDAGAEVTDYVNHAFGGDVAVFTPEALATFVTRVAAHLIEQSWRWETTPAWPANVRALIKSAAEDLINNGDSHVTD